MVDRNSLGSLGPNVISVESVNETVYSVQGDNFVTGFHVEVRDGVAQIMEGVTILQPTSASFTLTLPYSTPGPYTLQVTNPDGRTSSRGFATPGTSASNDALRADS